MGMRRAEIVTDLMGDNQGIPYGLVGADISRQGSAQAVTIGCVA